LYKLIIKAFDYSKKTAVKMLLEGKRRNKENVKEKCESESWRVSENQG
jgi:hypothetical protein